MAKNKYFSQISHDFVETLARTHLSADENKIVMAIIRLTFGYHQPRAKISGWAFHQFTYMSYQNINHTKIKLSERKIITIDGDEIGFNMNFNEWKDLRKRKLSKQTTCLNRQQQLSKQPTIVAKTDNKRLPNETTIKYNKYNTKENINIKDLFGEITKELKTLGRMEKRLYSDNPFVWALNNAQAILDALQRLEENKHPELEQWLNNNYQEHAFAKAKEIYEKEKRIAR